jgi:hypothetical protein
MFNTMRFLTFSALLLTLCPYSLAINSDDDFSGAWLAWVCPAGVKNDPGQCSNFVLELFQKRDKLCGSHVFATAGAGRIDEGAAPSLTGTVSDGVANIVVESGRAGPPIRVRAELTMEKGRLQWRRLENPSGDYLLPLSIQLTKSRHGTLLTPVFQQKLKAACSTISNLPDETHAPQPTRSTP